MKNSPETLRKRNQLRKYWRENTDISKIPKLKKLQCKDCNKIKDCPWASSFSQTGNPEYRRACLDCLKIRYRDYSKKNRKKISLSSKLRRNEFKKKYIDYLGGSCSRCNYSKSIRALTFHHKDRKEKEFSLSEALDWSWEKVKKELDKCDLVCFNCHMEIEDEYEQKKWSDLIKG